MSATASNPSTQQLEQGKAKLWIVLVGVNHYQDSRIPNLRYCANDCQELAEALAIATQRFQETEIIALHDGGEKPPDKSEIINSIEKFSLAKPEDTVLFYFSGHGYLDFNNRPIFCVADTNLEDLAVTGLKLDILLNELRQCKAQRQLVWLDACQEREEQLHNRIKQNPTGKLLAVLEQQAQQSQDFYAMLSCNTDERSWEIPELKHGLFTYCLIEGLRGKAANNQGNIDADSLFKYVERSSSKFIKYKKNPLNEDSFSKGMGGTLKKSSTKLRVKRLPLNASQTPQRIVKGSGELIIGLAISCTQRKALIVDKLSCSEADISLCRILQGKGNFQVDYYFIANKHQPNIQQIIGSALQNKNNQTVLLYLAGSIESTNPETYELVCSSDTRINFNWLRQQLQDSPVQEIIIIADILDTSGDSKSLIKILQPSSDKSLCLITASTSIPNSKKFLRQLVTILETAGESSREFWVSELITQLKEWPNSQPEINFKIWLSGSTEVMEMLSVEVQRSYNEIFDIDVCPYKSLKAFTQDDAYFFHGREELIAEIIEKLQSTSFLPVVGASGSGKSSVVKAGVIPQLLTEGFFDLESEQFKPCQTWVMLPGDNPIAALANTLAPDNPDFLEGVLHLGVDSLVEWLNQQSKSISVLAIDQFEELFTLTAETDRVNFLNLVLDAIEKTKNTFKVIITLRSDFLNECLGMSELAALITKSQVLVASCRLEDKQYRQIIAQPARKVGLEVEDGLIAILLGELKEGSLPLLQYALEELWQKRSRGKLTVKDYQQHIGKLGKFLSSKAQETYDNLSEAEKECAQSIFLSLVFLVKEQEDSNKDTRRRLPISDLLVDKYKNVLDSTLQALIEARLIVVSGEENNLSLVNDKENQQKSDLAVAAVEEETVSNQSKDKVTVEIAHEILLRDWEALKWWLEKNREKYRLIKEINQKADDWEENGKRDGFLLSKGALGKYEEFYVNYADELSVNSNQFINVSIQARDKGEKLAKRRQRQIIGGLTGGIVAISMVAGAALWQLRRATINEINALNNSSEMLINSNRLFDSIVTGVKAASKMRKVWLGVDLETRISVLGNLQNAFYRVNGVNEFNRLECHNCEINGMFFSPDDQIIATASNDNTVKLLNLDGQLLHTLEGHNGKINGIFFSPDGQIIATASDDNSVNLWNLNGQLLHTLESHNGKINGIFFSPDGQIIATASGDNSVKLWNLNGQLLHTLEGHLDSVNEIIFSPDGQIIATASGDNSVKLWNLNGQLLHTLESIYFSKFNYINLFELSDRSDRTRMVFTPDSQMLAFNVNYNTVKLWNLKDQQLQNVEIVGERFLILSPDGRTIASISEDKTVKLWNLEGQLLKEFDGLSSEIDDINEIIFSPDGQKIAAISTRDNIVQVWDFNGQVLNVIRNTYINQIAFSPDSQIMISSEDVEYRTVKLWTLKGELLYTLQDANLNNIVKNIAFSNNGQIIAFHSNEISNAIRLLRTKSQLLSTFKLVRDIAFSPDSQTIATATSFTESHRLKDYSVKLWNLKGKLLHTLKGHVNLVTDITFSPDGQIIATASYDNTVKLWNLEGQLLHTLKGHLNSVNDIIFSPDGQIIATAIDDNSVKLWNLEGKLLHTLEGISGRIKKLVFSPDSQTIAASLWDNTVKLWNLKGQSLHELNDRVNPARDITFSPNGQIIATASDDNSVKLWNLDGQLLHTLKGHLDSVNEIIFSPDGQIIATASDDNSVKLWNLNGQLLHNLDQHTRPVVDITFSPDGQIIASASWDDTIKLWNLKGRLLQTLIHQEKFPEYSVEHIVFSPDGQTIASISGFFPNEGSEDTIKLWSLNLNETMKRGCNWARGYITNNPNVSEEDRKICDGIGDE